MLSLLVIPVCRALHAHCPSNGAVHILMVEMDEQLDPHGSIVTGGRMCAAPETKRVVAPNRITHSCNETGEVEERQGTRTHRISAHGRNNRLADGGEERPALKKFTLEHF